MKLSYIFADMALVAYWRHYVSAPVINGYC